MYSDTKAKLVAENRELRAEVERLRGVVNDLGEMLGDVRKQRDAATARAEASEKEALEYIDYRNQAVISRNAMERRLEAAEALVAGLRGALEEARKDSERLDWLEAHPRIIVAATGYRGAKDSWYWRDETDALATHETATLRAAIDSARGTK